MISKPKPMWAPYSMLWVQKHTFLNKMNNFFFFRRTYFYHHTQFRLFFTPPLLKTSIIDAFVIFSFLNKITMPKVSHNPDGLSSSSSSFANMIRHNVNIYAYNLIKWCRWDIDMYLIRDKWTGLVFFRFCVSLCMYNKFYNEFFMLVPYKDLSSFSVLRLSHLPAFFFVLIRVSSYSYTKRHTQKMKRWWNDSKRSKISNDYFQLMNIQSVLNHLSMSKRTWFLFLRLEEMQKIIKW